MIDLGFSLQPQYNLPVAKVIELLAESGFSAVSPLWSPELNLDHLISCADAHNMKLQSLHAPHKGISKLWKPDTPDSIEAQANIMRCVDACAQFHIPIMVLHCWSGVIYTFPEEPLDFRFFDSLVDYAKQRGISIAMENLEGEEYLDAVMTRYRDQPHIGFCWDSGHDHCYPHKLDFLEQFGDRLIMTHLNDNLGLRDPSGIPSGNDDLHFLPYDGNIPWEHTLLKLKNAPKQTILNFEFKVQSHSKDPADLLYANLPLETFLRTAGIRARQIAQLYEKVLSENV